ncbi:MAG: excinuclease ABC subunit UvrC [Candidatus Enterosoma sp.]|nr:excinuclease ABC subunit UvrC [Candidatus Enterosoma sp.]MDY5432187.1 excinuclease ABC subunit UvrC [Candidatus Enterosoma sp.]MDY5971215.1 excinuclease ABC subunit UvrC [Candidatus Enterosoma sp.]
MSYLDYPVLKQKISLLPDKPGSYQMKDEQGNIIYVGKAKSLLKRVKQYFVRPQTGKVFRMVQEIRDFDIIETSSEKEALLLEISLIHKYYPKYNIMLMDDKMYPYIALKKSGDPFLRITRSDKEKGYRYFGPYPNASKAYKVIDLMNKVFPIRKCQNIPAHPCLYYHMGQCLAPCINKVQENKYIELRQSITRFLNGDVSFVTQKLHLEMKQYADNLEFEKAKECKDLLDAIEEIKSKQNVMFQDHIDRDVMGYSVREGYVCVVFLLYRRGVLLGKNVYIEELEDDLEDLLENLAVQFYQKQSSLPKELIVLDKQMAPLLEEALKINVVVPSRGKKKDLLLMADDNAKQMLDQHFQTARLEDDVLSLLEELKEKLSLKKTPLDIELYDNSHLQGYDPVGAMVKFINGEKAPSLYRKYKITQPNPQDDTASMREVLSRRFKRLKEENQKLPDLILLDGGFAQCAVGLEVKEEYGLDIPIAGLEKNDKHATDSLINADTGEIIPLKRSSKLFFLLMRMQDEIHRYAITYHRGKRGKSKYKTVFDDIPGIGPKRKDQLLQAYPSTEDLYTATLDGLMRFVPEAAAKEVLLRVEKLKAQQEEFTRLTKDPCCGER